MASTRASTSSHQPSDPTFRHYAPSQAKLYAQHRSPYPPQLISTIIDLHTSTFPDPSNALSTVVDIGCGPGTATRSIAPYFERAIGLDPGESMIETARSIGGQSRSGREIEFAVSSAETIDEALLKIGIWDGKEPCVDLITAATSAHWFDLPFFYAAASKVLRPGGSIIMWCSGSWYADKRKYPAEVGKKVQALIDKFELEVLKEFELEGNRLCRGLYAELRMPWDVDAQLQRELGLEVFEKESGVRKTWNENGVLEDGVEGGWMRSMRETSTEAGKTLGTASSVTRWREKNREKLGNGEIEDCVDVLVRDVRDAGGWDMEKFEGGWSTGVVMVKRRNE